MLEHFLRILVFQTCLESRLLVFFYNFQAEDTQFFQFSKWVKLKSAVCLLNQKSEGPTGQRESLHT